MSTPKAPIDAMLDALEWRAIDPYPSPDGLPIVTHEGILNLMGVDLRVYRLSDGNRVIHNEDMGRLFETMAGKDPTP